MQNLVDQFVCPYCHGVGLHLFSTTPPTREPLPEYGYAICNNCTSPYPITGHILDLAPYNPDLPLTVAGTSNNAPLAPSIYEKIWRPRALSLLTGESFPEVREIEWLVEWAHLEPGQLVLDLGTSTGLYARGLIRALNVPGATQPEIVALDLSSGMLSAARRYARREGIDSVTYLRAPAERLPFANQSVDAIVCGGSLNEFHTMDAALSEMRRVIKPEGRIVATTLLKGQDAGSRLIQRLFTLSGIQFPTLETFNATVSGAGLAIEQQQVRGIVAFSLLHARQGVI